MSALGLLTPELYNYRVNLDKYCSLCEKAITFGHYDRYHNNHCLECMANPTSTFYFKD